MEVMRQKNQTQLKLTSFEECKGETLNTSKWVETSMTMHKTENPTRKKMEIESDRLMEEIVDRKNMLEALKRVIRNKGKPGIDGMTVNELGTYLENHWEQIKQELLQGYYEPQPVKRVYIDKPGKIEKRALGIPCVI